MSAGSAISSIVRRAPARAGDAADRYSAPIGEFVVQNHTLIGEFPRIDFFVNAKVQQTRIFFKYEHINSDRTGYNFYSAPFTPYRDSIIRFGIVWNFFQ